MNLNEQTLLMCIEYLVSGDIAIALDQAYTDCPIIGA
jgi:hypothetical protein